MEIQTREIFVKTKGFNDILDITAQVHNLLMESGLNEGQVTVFVSGSTGGLTTIEYEPGLLQDIPEFFESIIPMRKQYHHDKTWHDGNGYAHLRAALIKPSLTIPFRSGRLLLGTWQQIIFIDFDNRSRSRSLIAQLIGVKKTS
jgi:secondary thiamine-phosphate synthase enzyme